MINKKLEKILKLHLKLKSLKKINEIKKYKLGKEFDSLTLISMISSLAKNLHIKITPEKISKIKTIEDIMELVKKDA
jgi:acyl carrier protein